MNILTIVFSMLMMLSILTYARYRIFVDFSAMKTQYVSYTDVLKRNPYNLEQKELYDGLKGSKKEKEEKNEDETEDDKKPDSKKLNSKLSFNIFVKKEEREANPEMYQHQRYLFLNLMEYLYGEHPFFQEVKEKRPNIFEEILNDIMKVTENDPYLGKKEGLANLQLSDIDLRECYYRILKGTREKEHESEEFLEKQDYLSLEYFIAMQSPNKISIYLAPGELLMAIYDDEELVKQIFDERAEIYLKLKRVNGLSVEDGSQQFETKFRGKSGINNEDLVLDFRVSKTDPRQYQ